MVKRKTYTIDASNQPLGRLAVEVADILRGKRKVDFVPYKDMGDFVLVKNIEKVGISGKKMDRKIYYRHSGYPGGFKKERMGVVFEKSPEKVLKKAVQGMLPKNKLRAIQIKRLQFHGKEK
jgi:large subunit ribosomal protein L13